MNDSLISRSMRMMGTTITIKINRPAHVSTVEALDALEAGFGEFDRIVTLYTRFAETSQLIELNNQSGSWVKVSEEFFELISRMLNLSEITNGAFDPTVIDFLEVYGYDKNYDFSKLDNPTLDSMIQNIAATRPSWEQIELDKKNLKVKLAKGQRLDLGGIGKGYAIDCAVEKLALTENFLIDAGGDIYGRGVNLSNESWVVDLKHIDRMVGQIALAQSGEALACSGTWSRKVKQFHHLINPASGKSDAHFDTVFILATNATTADSWGTAVAVGGKAAAEKLPEGTSFLAIDSEGKLLGNGELIKRLGLVE